MKYNVQIVDGVYVVTSFGFPKRDEVEDLFQIAREKGLKTKLVVL